MIVDLVRNDLSRICEVGSVEVPELCGIHSFSHVHQMISTIQGRLLPNKGFESILEALFPMGSMTGAPKLEVMKYIDQLESFERTFYSGSIGYFYQGDFDLNVVIRSIQYDFRTENITYCVGGAITFDSVADQEFQECITKAAAIAETLSFELVSNTLNGEDKFIV
jgi:para-aminobenzoate synthetase component 1